MGVRGIRYRAVITGWSLDIVGSILGSSLVLSILAPDAADPQALGQRLSESSSLAFGLLLLGLMFDVLGGYVAARLAPGEELVNAVAVGVLSGVSGALLTIGQGDAGPMWLQAAGPVLAIPFAAFGGYLRMPAPPLRP
ncbi:MAG: hypothetical protein M3O91_09985 [Chloroflexota bacterium]|nr:hypothetical protein [Chloroflexota bacterium]